ncbi:MAG: AraC family transcriptional regulator [Winogradskyella sp.]|nr:MAG: AraC family transcriptional regulator [Winogradskyella sp.]
MKTSTIIILFLSAFALINGVFLSLYLLFFIKYKHISNKFLGALFLLFSIRVGKSILIYVNQDFASFYFQLGITVCFFFGPFLYFYIESLFHPEKNINRNWIYHCIPILVVAIILGIVLPSMDFFLLWKNYLIYAAYLIWLLYIIKSGGIIRTFIFKTLKNNDFKNWLVFIYFGNVMLWLIHITSKFTSYSYISFSIGLLIYSLIFLLIFTTYKSNLFSIERIKLQIVSHAKNDGVLITKLEQLMNEEELFKNNNLKSSVVADRLGIPVYKLSKIINKSYNKNFSNYVNEFRVEYAKVLLTSNNNYTIEAIGQESGFKSKSSFYNAFKKITGKTPSSFI